MAEDILQNTDLDSLLRQASGALPVKLTNDLFFHAVMQDDQVVMKGMVGSVLGIDPESIGEIQVLNPYDFGKQLDSKWVVLDLKLALENGEFVNIEIQVYSMKYWADRSLFYMARTFGDEKPDNDYSNLAPVIQINFLDFPDRGRVPEFHDIFQMRSIKNEGLYSDKLCVHQIDLTHRDLATSEDSESGLVHWAELFKADTWEKVRALAVKNRYIKEAAFHMITITADKRKLMMMEDNEKARLDSQTMYHEGVNHGLQKGLQEGLQKGIIQGKVLERIDVYSEEGMAKDEIRKKIMEKFSLSESEADELLSKYGEENH